MDFFLGGGGAERNCQQSLFRIQGTSDFRTGEIKNLKQEKKRKESQGPLSPSEVSVRL